MKIPVNGMLAITLSLTKETEREHREDSNGQPNHLLHLAHFKSLSPLPSS
jgi:hypothetical protein